MVPYFPALKCRVLDTGELYFEAYLKTAQGLIPVNQYTITKASFTDTGKAGLDTDIAVDCEAKWTQLTGYTPV